MADTITIPATGSGTAAPVVATDDVSGVHYQRVKLVDGTADSTALIPGDASNGLDVDVTRVPTDPFGANADAASATGSISAKLRFIAATGIPVTGTVTVGAHAVTNAGTFAVQAAGDVAHDAADSGNPVKIGGKARQTNPTAVADADRVDATFDDLGRQVVVLSQVRDLVTHQHTEIANSSSETTILTAVASTFLDLVALIITNQSNEAVVATIKDATAGTTRMKLAIPAQGGAVLNFAVPVPQAAANNNWTVTLSSATVTVDVFVQAVKNV